MRRSATPGAGLLLAGLSLALAACTPPDGASAEATGLRQGSIDFRSCSLSTVGASAVEAHCATFEVPEDHDAPEGRKIGLAIAFLPKRIPW